MENEFKTVFKKYYRKPRFYDLVCKVGSKVNPRPIAILWTMVATLMYFGDSPYFNKYLFWSIIVFTTITAAALCSKAREIISIYFIITELNQDVLGSDLGIGYSEVLTEAQRQGLI